MTKQLFRTGFILFSLCNLVQAQIKPSASLKSRNNSTIAMAHILKGSNFTITVKIGKMSKSAKIYLNYAVKGLMQTESTGLVNGAFSFHGTIEDIASCSMTLSHNGKGTGDDDILKFDFGPENIEIISSDSLHNAAVKGSKVYIERKEYETVIAPSSSSIYMLARKKENALSASETADSARTAAIKTWERDQKAACKQRLTYYIEAHPGSRYSVDALRELFYVFGFSMEDLETKFNNLNSTAKSSYQGKKLAKWLMTKKEIQPGRTAPTFTSNTPDNKILSLSDFKNKWLLLEFWASWCIPCRSESPNLIAQYGLYQHKGFEILSFSADNDKKGWLKAIAQDKLTWKQISDLDGMNSSKIIELYGVEALPFNVLINPDGKIVATNLRGNELNKQLQQVFEGNPK